MQRHLLRASRVLVRPGLAVAVGLALAACSTPMPLAPQVEAQATASVPPPATIAAVPEATEAAVSAAAPPAATPATAESASPAPAADDESAPAVLQPYDPLQPEATVDLADRNAHADLWQRVRAGFTLPDLDTPDVKEWEQWYASRPDYVARMTSRGSRYLFHITEEVEKRHMPTELALLPFTESAYNPQALSVAKASGMWQFISSTGKDYDLKQNIFRDDRRDVLASTQAALDYLQKLHDMFGDWQLALAAYNCGEGNVQRAIARNQRAGLPTDYLSLKLPAETRGYVPKLQAVKNIVARPQAFGLALPPLQNHPYFLSVPIERDMDVDMAARLAGVSLDEFRMLNPQLNKPVILAAGTPQVLLPYDNADDFVRAVQAHQGPLATWTAWVAGKTLRPAEAARLVGMSEGELREVNHIPPHMLVKAGSTLLVPRSAQHSGDVSEHIADSAAMSLAPDLPPTRRVNVRVARGGETVASVARRWRVSATQVASWNHVSASGRFRAGTTAVVFVPRVTATEIARAAVASSRGSHPGADRVAKAAGHGGAAVHGARVAQASRQAAHGSSAHAKSPVHVAKSSSASRAGGSSSSRTLRTTRSRIAQR